MKTEIINIKTDPATKKQAHKIANEMGLNLSTVINGLLKGFIRTQAVYFTNQKEEVPSKWLERSLARAQRDEKEGYVSPAFENVEDAIAWLNDPKAKYINGKNK